MSARDKPRILKSVTSAAKALVSPEERRIRSARADLSDLNAQIAEARSRLRSLQVAGDLAKTTAEKDTQELRKAVSADIENQRKRFKAKVAQHADDVQRKREDLEREAHKAKEVMRQAEAARHTAASQQKQVDALTKELAEAIEAAKAKETHHTALYREYEEKRTFLGEEQSRLREWEDELKDLQHDLAQQAEANEATRELLEQRKDHLQGRANLIEEQRQSADSLRNTAQAEMDKLRTVEASLAPSLDNLRAEREHLRELREDLKRYEDDLRHRERAVHQATAKEKVAKRRAEFRQ